MSSTTYKDAGVDIDAGNRAVRLMKDRVAQTHGPAVLAGVGAFGGLFSLSGCADMEAPVLAASTDGVGTKVRLATEYGRLDTIGQDLVNHCVDDILVQGAEPLFFLDYVASSRLIPEEVAEIVSGMAVACRAAGCALLGGETAEMPGVYAEGEVDVVGTIVGVVDRPKIIDGSRIAPGDVVLGLPSASPHTNGYSLIRHVLDGIDLAVHEPALDAAPIDLLLRPHRSYLGEVRALMSAGVEPRGMVHITGGGFWENPPRVLRPGLSMVVDRASWTVPPLFRWIQSRGQIDDVEMFRVFNMGIGLLLVVSPEQVDEAMRAVPDELIRIGEIRESGGAPVEFVPAFQK